MSEAEFILCQDDFGNYEIRYEDKVFHFLWEVAPILNEQQSIIRRDEISIKTMMFNMKKLEEENIELKKLKKYCAEWMGVKEENLSLRCGEMIEKRFVYYEHKGADYILDTPNTELDFIEMLGDALETEEIVDKLNEQDMKIRQLERSVERREEQISIIKKHCKTYLTEEQYKTIKEALSVI